MKKFDALTEEQQKQAVAFAQKELKEALSIGTVIVGAKLSDKEVTELARVVAEESAYDDQGNAVVEGMDVPSYFLGGCV